METNYNGSLLLIPGTLRQIFLQSEENCGKFPIIMHFAVRRQHSTVDDHRYCASSYSPSLRLLSQTGY